MTDEPMIPLLAIGLRLVAEGPWSERANAPLEEHVALVAEKHGIEPQPWPWWPEARALSVAHAGLLLLLAGGPSATPARAPARARGVPDLMLGVRAVREGYWIGRGNDLLAASIAERAAQYQLAAEDWFWWPAWTARSHAAASRFLDRLNADRAEDSALRFGREEIAGTSVPAMSAQPGAGYLPPERFVAQLPGEGYGLEERT
jgi:hypothetical protein